MTLRIRRRLEAAVVVLGLIASSALVAMGVTAEREREQLRNLHAVVGYLAEALRYTAATPGHGDVASQVISALPELSRELVILHGVCPENEGDRPATSRWHARSREDQLLGEGGARFLHNRVRSRVRDARRMTRKVPELAGARAHLGNALAALDAFDWSLPYEADADAPVIGRPGIGHGSRHRTVNRIHRGFEYDTRHIGGRWLRAYESEGPTSRVQFELSQLLVVSTVKHRAIGLLERIYDEPAEPACQVLEAFRLLWMDGGQAYHFAFGEDPLSDGWRTSLEMASQAAFELPLCNGTRSPEA